LTVTGPVARFARQIAGQGYIVAAPSSYHEFTGPEALKYDAADTDRGNEWKVAKKLSAYDEDASLSVDYLLSLPTCTGRIGATGMCLGGHLAYRCALDKRVHATVCYFATDIHSRTLGRGKDDDSLARAGDINGEITMVGYFSSRCMSSVWRCVGKLRRIVANTVVFTDLWEERHTCSPRGTRPDSQDAA
jgi:dienelactone hydrolase